MIFCSFALSATNSATGGGFLINYNSCLLQSFVRFALSLLLFRKNDKISIFCKIWKNSKKNKSISLTYFHPCDPKFLSNSHYLYCFRDKNFFGKIGNFGKMMKHYFVFIYWHSCTYNYFNVQVSLSNILFKTKNCFHGVLII